MVISSLLFSSYSFLTDTAGFFSALLFFADSLFGSFPLSVLSVSPRLLPFFCFLLLLSSCLSFSLPPLVSFLPPRCWEERNKKGKILSMPALLLLLSIKSRPHGGFQHHGSWVVDVCWVSMNIKTCRLGRKIKAGGLWSSGLSVPNVLFVWDMTLLLSLTEKLGSI